MGHEILSDVSFIVEPGVTALLGPNGAGKTTLLEEMARTSREMGFMPQRWRPVPGFSVRDCIAYAAWLKGVPRRSSTDLVERALALVDLAHLGDRKASRLSGGERQRVGLAESLVHEPSVLLLDEPTVGLDPEQRAAFRSVLRKGAAPIVLLSTHLIDDVVAVAEQVVILVEGRVAFEGPVDLLAAESADAADGPEAGYLALVSRWRTTR